MYVKGFRFDSLLSEMISSCGNESNLSRESKGSCILVTGFRFQSLVSEMIFVKWNESQLAQRIERIMYHCEGMEDSEFHTLGPIRPH